jgi:hypothetical protein
MRLAKNLSMNLYKSVWFNHNQSLVRRGEILIGFDVIDNWDMELKEMDKDKVGLGVILLS